MTLRIILILLFFWSGVTLANYSDTQKFTHAIEVGSAATLIALAIVSAIVAMTRWVNGQ